MPIILFSKAMDEENARVKVEKYFDRVHIRLDGSAECLLEFILYNLRGSPVSVSSLHLWFPDETDPSQFQDVSETFKDPRCHENQEYTQGWKAVDSEHGLFLIDGVVAHVANNSPSDRIQFLDADQNRHVRMTFQPIAEDGRRAFRVRYNMPKFAEIYSSVGQFTYHFNHTLHDQALYYQIERYIKSAIPINRRLCEVMVLLPEDFVFDYAVPSPTTITTNFRKPLLSSELLVKGRTQVYFDLEDKAFDLPGRGLREEIEPTPEAGIGIFCMMRRPGVADSVFRNHMGEMMKGVTETIGTLNTARTSLEEFRTWLRGIRAELEAIVRQSKKAFFVTLLISLVALLVSAIGAIPAAKQVLQSLTSQ